MHNAPTAFAVRPASRVRDVRKLLSPCKMRRVNRRAVNDTFGKIAPPPLGVLRFTIVEKQTDRPAANEVVDPRAPSGECK